MRLPRMTIRRWMIIVLLIGVMTGGIVGGLRLKRCQEHFGSLVERYAAVERECLKVTRMNDEQIKSVTRLLDSFEKNPLTGPAILERTRSMLRESQDRQAAWAQKLAYYVRLKHKYEYAARHPWLPVEPDPPEPE